jgi:hypothetical protein
MKKSLYAILITLIVLLYTFSDVHAQHDSIEKRNGLKISVGIFTKIKLTYEVALNNRFSTGLSAGYSTGLSAFRGIKIDPFLRVYTGRTILKGLYFQARAFYYNLTTTNTAVTYKGVNYAGIGYGTDIGYQFFIGRKHSGLIDLSMGIQIIPGYETGENEDLIFATTGPCGIFTPRASLGLCF